jgi:uncharacterized protein (TIGR02145 family)
LKAKSGWYKKGNGTDYYEFSALPGGYRINNGNFGRVGEFGYWWTATEYGVGSAYYRDMDYNYDYVGELNGYKNYGQSVRCVED